MYILNINERGVLMANITVLEALNKSLTATKKYVDDEVAKVNGESIRCVKSL